MPLYFARDKRPTIERCDAYHGSQAARWAKISTVSREIVQEDFRVLGRRNTMFPIKTGEILDVLVISSGAREMHM